MDDEKKWPGAAKTKDEALARMETLKKLHWQAVLDKKEKLQARLDEEIKEMEEEWQLWCTECGGLLEDDDRPSTWEQGNTECNKCLAGANDLCFKCWSPAPYGNCTECEVTEKDW